MPTPDLSKARQRYHHRDDALDESWGEGSEVTLYDAPDGAFYLHSTSFHVDWGERTNVSLITRDDAMETVARHEGVSGMRRMFPDSAPLRWHARYGVCKWYGLRDHLAAVEADAEVGFHTDEPLLTLWVHPDDLWIVEDVHPVSNQPYKRLMRQRDAQGVLRKAGCPGAVLRRLFPGTPVVQLLDQLGVEDWADAERDHLPALAAASQQLAIADLDEDGVLTLWRLDAPTGAFLVRKQLEGQVTFNALDPVHGAQVLSRMGS
jgi:hypothetical protein